jgi:serine/tyrosine/threonine adenylyltransferase
MRALAFDNRFVHELPGENGPPTTPRQVHGAAWSHATPTPVPAPRVVAYSREVAALLGLSDDDARDPAFAEVFAGNRVVPGMQPYAACYGGHQFGSWAGQLGDGRAITLGEIVTPTGRQELQLKGAGPTPYSRRADGRAVLRSSIREFLCSEAMHHLGVPTTRALSLVATGALVTRDMLYDGNPKDEPGAIVCRVAPSFIRFGNFEIFAAREDHALLEKLVDFTIARDFPALAAAHDEPAARRAAWFVDVCERTARLLAEWMRVGFVHGVMNTDNMSILGLTIDYGPYGWIDDFDVGWTPNTTDAGGRRYRFGAQPEIGFWNVARLAQALAPVVDEAALERGLDAYERAYDDAWRATTAAKLGWSKLDDDDAQLAVAGFRVLQEAGLDMTIFFRALADVDVAAPSTAPLADAWYSDAQRAQHEPALAAWLAQWAARARRDDVAPAARKARMNAANPKYVLRNYLAQEAIDACEAGDDDAVARLLDVLRRPYDDQPGHEKYAARRPEWAREKVGCSMLSCSS